MERGEGRIILVVLEGLEADRIGHVPASSFSHRCLRYPGVQPTAVFSLVLVVRGLLPRAGERVGIAIPCGSIFRTLRAHTHSHTICVGLFCVGGLVVVGRGWAARVRPSVELWFLGWVSGDFWFPWFRPSSGGSGMVGGWFIASW